MNNIHVQSQMVCIYGLILNFMEMTNAIFCKECNCFLRFLAVLFFFLKISVEERRFARQRTLGSVLIDVSQVKPGDRISDLYPAFATNTAQREDGDAAVCSCSAQDASVL